jgi:Caspase domain
MPFPNGHALLIGVGGYTYLPNWHVPTTLHDAQAVAAALRDPQYCGYPEAQVTLLNDATADRAGVLAALDALIARTSQNDTIFLFYSGHGHFDEDGTYYLTTHDTQLTAARRVVAGTAVSQGELIARLQALPARRMLLIFRTTNASDCRSGLWRSLGSELPATLAVIITRLSQTG